MGLRERLCGAVTAELTGGETARFLNDCLSQGLALLRTESPAPYTLRVTVYEAEAPKLQALAERRGLSWRTVTRRGGRSDREGLKKRLPLLLLLGLTLLLLCSSRFFVWDIELSGAEGLSRGSLRRILAEEGLELGAFRPTLDTEALKTRVLLRCDSLAWLSVNLRGSRAEVQLLARRAPPELYDREGSAVLTAAKPGVVRSLSVLEGRAEVQPGQAVLAGEPLISGEGRARGEVWAETERTQTALCPLSGTGKSGKGRSLRRYALKIGKTRLNFYRNSGNSLDGYDKIYWEAPLSVPGLFSLPLCLVCEELRSYEAAPLSSDRADAMALRLLQNALKETEGTLRAHSFTEREEDSLIAVTLRASFLENIAK